MNEAVELPAGLRIVKHDFPENLAIDGSVRGENTIAECLNDRHMNRLTGLQQLMCDVVRVDQVASQLDKHTADGALACGDSTGEPDPGHQRPRRIRAAFTVFFISIAIVIGPTPPGTGVSIDATSFTERWSTSPAQT